MLTAEGDALSEIVLSMLPAGRQAGTNSTGVILFSRLTEAEADITIPKGTICATVAEDGTLIEFATDEAAVLAAGETTAYVEATSTKPGVNQNVSTGTVNIIRTPIVGIISCSNDGPFEGGTDQESDEDLRNRALYTIWVAGKATIPMMEEHINGVEGVREVQVQTLGQGDVLMVIDASNEAGVDDAITAMILDNLAAGCTAPGVLGGSVRGETGSYEIGDCSPAPVWCRTLQFCATEVEVPFTYQEPDGTTKSGTATIPAGSKAGTTIKAVLDTEFPNAITILGSTYAGELNFDLYMGLGEYPHLWVAPELQEVDIALEITMTETPELDLLENIQASLEAALASYRIGEQLEYADLVKYLYVDFTSGRAFSGIDDVESFEITCKGSTITGFGQSVAIDEDERIEPGTVTVTEAT